MANPIRMLKAVRHVRRFPEVLSCVRSTSQWPRVVSAYLGVKDPRYPIDLRLRSGAEVTLETYHDLVTAWVVLFRPDYQVDPGCRSILDVGANIGIFSLHAAAVAPAARIVALEPFPSTFARLEEHVRRNSLSPRVTCHPWALATRDGEQRMNTSALLPSQSRGLTDDPGGIPVRSVTLETLLKMEALSEVDLLKIDIEGGEHDVLQEAPDDVLRRIKAIALEYHPNRPKETLFGRLRDAGFRLTSDVPAGRDSGVAHFRR